MYTSEGMRVKRMCKWLVVYWSALVMWALVLNVGAEDVKSSTSDEGGAVVAYWERKLHGAMPSSIHAMLTPLSSQQATQLLIKSRFLPNDAATFCKAARIKCVQAIPSQKKTQESSFMAESQSDSDENPFFLYHSESQSDSDENPFFLYHSESQSDSDENPFFLYHSARPSIMQNDASHKGPGEVSSQALDGISPKLTELPLFLRLPAIREVGYGFREKQVLVTGQKIYVNIARGRQGGDVAEERAFLPRKLARLFLLKNGGSKIASMLGISRESLMKTIDQCEAQSKNDYQHAEVKACLTSLEDVVDFVSNIMGSSKPIKVYDAIFNASSYKFVGKTFTVLDVETLQQDLDEPVVSCHDMHFPFHVFFCHYAKHTKSFSVTLQAEDGSVHARIVICHYDTSYWDPHHIFFQELHFKPGEGEICHWLSPTWMKESGWLFSHA